MRWLLALAAGVGVLLIARGARAASILPRGQLLDEGVASWYGPGFNGKQTASREIFDENDLTAAHRTIKFGTLVDVTNLDNGITLRVKVNDRGPFPRDASGNFSRVIDLSRRAAHELGYEESGLANVEIRAV